MSAYITRDTFRLFTSPFLRSHVMNISSPLIYCWSRTAINIVPCTGRFRQCVQCALTVKLIYHFMGQAYPNLGNSSSNYFHHPAVQNHSLHIDTSLYSTYVDITFTFPGHTRPETGGGGHSWCTNTSISLNIQNVSDKDTYVCQGYPKLGLEIPDIWVKLVSFKIINPCSLYLLITRIINRQKVVVV